MITEERTKFAKSGNTVYEGLWVLMGPLHAPIKFIEISICALENKIFLYPTHR